MKIHKLAKLFPEITGDDFKALALDIKQHGLRQKITTLDGQVLDGANRYKACLAAGVEPEFKEFVGDDPLAFVVSQNMNRRHLTTSQRAAVAAEIATSGHGGSRGQDGNSVLENKPVTNEEAAEQMKVSKDSVGAARKLKRDAPKQFRQVKSGEKSLHAAQQELRPKKSQPEPPKSGFNGDGELTPPQPRSGTVEVDPDTSPLNPAKFQVALNALVARVPDGDDEHRNRYGVMLNKAAEVQINWGRKVAKGAYGY